MVRGAAMSQKLWGSVVLCALPGLPSSSPFTPFPLLEPTSWSQLGGQQRTVSSQAVLVGARPLNAFRLFYGEIHASDEWWQRCWKGLQMNRYQLKLNISWKAKFCGVGLPQTQFLWVSRHPRRPRWLRHSSWRRRRRREIMGSGWRLYAHVFNNSYSKNYQMQLRTEPHFGFRFLQFQLEYHIQYPDSAKICLIET